MDLNFNKVTYDGDLSDFSEDELRELVGEFETAQESNVAEFETAAETIDSIDESTIEDFEAARQSLIEDITGAEAFDKVPLTEDKLENEDFSDLQEWQEFVADEQSVDEQSDPSADEDGEFDDLGKKSPTHSDEDKSEEFVERELGAMKGVNL